MLLYMITNQMNLDILLMIVCMCVLPDLVVKSIVSKVQHAVLSHHSVSWK